MLNLEPRFFLCWCDRRFPDHGGYGNALIVRAQSRFHHLMAHRLVSYLERTRGPH